jgi:hypothetical protein
MRLYLLYIFHINLHYTKLCKERTEVQAWTKIYDQRDLMRVRMLRTLQKHGDIGWQLLRIL